MEALAIENEVKFPTTWKERTYMDLTWKKPISNESQSTYSIEIQVSAPQKRSSAQSL